MSTALEAENAEAAEEAAAAAALEAEDHAKADAAEASRLSEEAAATGMTQAEREAAAEHDGGSPDNGTRTRKKRAPAQGNLAGGWEELIGGAPDTDVKVSLKKPVAVHLDNQPEPLRKQTVHRILLTVKVTGWGSDDTLDPETHDVASSLGKRTLRVTGGRFLDPDEYVVDGNGNAIE